MNNDLSESVNSNAYRLCFWCLAHLLFDRALLAAIRAEIQPAFDRTADTLDMPYLLDRCPRLASLYEEVLRVANDPIGARVVRRGVAVGGKTLRPGRRLLMPYRQLHFDERVFGPDAGRFNPARFLDDGKGSGSKHSLLRSPSWRPFGGAATHCPGRFLARREVYMFVALVLLRFDVRLAPVSGDKGNGGMNREPKFPVLDDSIPSGGVLGPVPGDDVVVEVRLPR